MKAVATFYPDQATTWPTDQAAHEALMSLALPSGFKVKTFQVPEPWRIDIMDEAGKVIAYIKEDTTP